MMPGRGDGSSQLVVAVEGVEVAGFWMDLEGRAKRISPDSGGRSQSRRPLSKSQKWGDCGPAGLVGRIGSSALCTRHLGEGEVSQQFEVGKKRRKL